MSTGRMGSLKIGQGFPAPKQALGHEGIIRSGMCAQTFLNSASDGGEWPPAHPNFTSRT